MRRPVELCLATLVVATGLALFGESPSGISPLSVLEARTVIGGATTGESDCPVGEVLTYEDQPGTGCDSTCVRIPNAYTTSKGGGQVPEATDCPNRCGHFWIASTPCGT